MKILVLSWRDPKHPLAGGAEQVMHEHAKGWVESGYEVTFFTAYFQDAPRREVIDGITFIRYGYQLLGVHIAAFFWYLFITNNKFDLVIDQFHGLPFFTPLYVRVKKIAVLQEIAKEVWLMNHLPKPLNWIIGWIGYLSEPFYFLFYKNIPFITGSDSAKKDLLNFGIPEKNITVVPHGVILNLPKIQVAKEDARVIIFLGALAKDKGIEDAIDAMYILKLNMQNQKFRFWIIGKGSEEYKKFLAGQINKYQLTQETKFFGFVSQKEKFELLAKSYILINPSVREGWGLVNIEANAVGVPVVAYKSPGLVDSVKDGVSGIICQQNTPKQLAELIQKLFEDKKFYQKLHLGAKKWSEKFSWEYSRKQSLDLIKKIIAND